MPQKPGEIAVTTNNFQKATENVLYEKTGVFRDMDIQRIRMIRGNLDESFTHLGINDALIRVKRIRGDNYIQAAGINAPIQEKVSFKDKVSKAVGLKKEQPKLPEIVTQPKPSVVTDYYLQLSEPQLKNIRGYFDAVAKLGKDDSYKNALNVASTANKVYDSVVTEISDLKQRPQYIFNKEQKTDMAVVKSRVGQGQSLGLNDFAGLLKEVATPKLDKNTWQRLKELGGLAQDKQQTKEFKQVAKKFASKTKALASEWSKNKNMPALNSSYFVPDAIKAVDKGVVTRDTLSRMYDLAEHTHESTLTKRKRKLGCEEEWSGGRGGWGY